MKYLFTLILICLACLCQAQLRDAVWILGYEGGAQSPPDDDFGGFILNFRDSVFPQQSIRQDIDMNFHGTNAAICDSLGNLLFYTNGEKIYKNNHTLMQNGDGIAKLMETGMDTAYRRGPSFYLSLVVKHCFICLM
ncbi:MAG: hypothetical protein R2792_03775 [Saprospiraceae bacterium]